MRIGLLCNEYPPGPHGGIGTFSRMLARALVQHGLEVRVAGCYPRDYPGASQEVDQGVRVSRLRRGAYPGNAWVARHRIWRQAVTWARRGEVDLIEVPDWEGWCAGWPELPVPVVVRLHGSVSYFLEEMAQPRQWGAFHMEKRALERADDWCSVSRYTARRTAQLFGLTKPSATVIYNPVNVPPPAEQPAGRSQRVVFTGTLTEKKGIVSLVRAWPAVMAACPDAELHVLGKEGRAGNGRPMTEYLRELLGSIQTSVHFHGHVGHDNLLVELRMARVAVFPSYAEAFALAPLEAMACGCPTIYSQRGSGPELITHEQDGLLVDPDHPEGIAAAIVRLLRDDSLASRLATEGERRVRDAFTLERLIPENVRFYQRAIDQFHRRSS